MRWGLLAIACCVGLGACLESTKVPAFWDAWTSDGASRDSTQGTRRGGPRPSSPGRRPARSGEPPAKLRFVVMGDGGTGSVIQHQVADAVHKVCTERGCDFALYLGDNIYEVGPVSVDDTQFITKFEDPYAELSFPFYVVLGNHDYIPGVIDRSQIEVDYTARSEKWVMPHQYYAFELGPALFVGIDTHAILFDVPRGREQTAFVEEVLAESDAPWRFMFGHHPYVSNGAHGSAGSYDGLDATWFPEASGVHFKRFFERVACGAIDVYFAGHDHDRQWLEPACGVTQVVSGAAAKLRPALRDAQPTRFQDGNEQGFLWVELDAWTLHGIFFDELGEADYEGFLER